ncbi:MAG: Xaa-Pro peptidase family protein [Acidobacteriota bacterium]|nr:Xaa-Pro peptidase family protein [Acidobacteriota bacterium]
MSAPAKRGPFPRLAAFQTAHVDERLDALLVTHGPNVFYLTGFRGSAGMLLVQSDTASLIVDSRYVTLARELLDHSHDEAAIELVEVERSYEETVAELVRRHRPRRVGFEAAHTTVSQYEWWCRALDDTEIHLERTTNLVEMARLVKDAEEISTLREAGVRIAGVMRDIRSRLTPGQSEREIAADVDWAIRVAGFEGPAFDTIVATGPNTALPHARPGPRRLVSGDLVLLDFGGVLDGYCVDVTRVVSLGPPPEAVRRWHQAVREAHDAALAAVVPGVLPTHVDHAARTVLEHHGMGDAFGHGTGHGLGIEVHEAPRLGKPRAQSDAEETALEPGVVFTVEPGVYFAGEGGIRLEDDVVVTDTGYELLTDMSLDLIVV